MRKTLSRSLIFCLMRKICVAALMVILPTANLVGQVSSSLLPSSNLRDNNPTVPGQTSPPPFRRIFIPEEAISVLSMPGIYWPISADVFHRLMDKTWQTGQPAGAFAGQPVLNSMTLSARLENQQQQLVSGQGVMRIDAGDVAVQPPTPPPDSANHAALSVSPNLPLTLSPFRLPISNPAWSNGNPAQLGLDKSGETVLFIPAGTSELTFDWTLRGEIGSRNELVFSLELPRFLRTELILDLPDDKKPIVPSGLVQHVELPVPREMTTESDIPPGFRRWRIVINGSQALRLVVTTDEKSEKFFHNIGVFERHLYDISLSGMELETRLYLEKSNFVLNELILELDKPLFMLSIKAGDRILSWSEVTPDNENMAKFLVSIPYLESDIPFIQVLTFCPIQSDQMWNLPVVHVRSPLFFRTETRNIVRVNRPLLTRKISAPQQRQVSPSPPVDETESDLFIFQAFSEESPLGIELGLKQTLLNLESGTSFQWEEREITARAILDLTVEEGQIQQLELIVDPNWTVDLIEAIDSTLVANYFLEGGEQETDDEPSPLARWIVPLRRVVEPSPPIRLIVQLRRPIATDELSFSSDPTQNHRYPLSDFMPIRVPGSREGQQLVAFEPGRQYRVITEDRRESSMSSPATEQIHERFDEMPLGTVFAVSHSYHDHFLEIASLQPTYEMAAVTNLVLQNGILWETCRFSCTPAENTPVDRLKILFSHERQIHNAGDWVWKLEQPLEISQQLKAVPIVSSDSPSHGVGETWELELPSPQSLPFVVTTTRVVRFDSRQAIPLPFFPDLPDVAASVCIETRDTTLYRVSQNMLSPVPPPFSSDTATNVSAWDNRAVRGVYRYPAGGAFVLENTMLVLEPVSSSVRTENDLANIWFLALHTCYFPEGDEVTYAVMAVENRTLNHLKVNLPHGVTMHGIRNLWIDHETSPWSFVSKNDGEGGDLLISLPSQRRYFTVTLEYVVPGDKLTDYRRLQPTIPTFEVPVFAQKWYAWYPPQYRSFDVSAANGKIGGQTFEQSRNGRENSDLGISLPFFDRDSAEFDLFSSRRKTFETIPAVINADVTACSLRLVNLLKDPALEQRIRRQTATNGVPETSFPDSPPQDKNKSIHDLTWGELFGSGVMENVIAHDEGSQNNGRFFTILIDGDSLAQVGIFPFAPVFSAVPAFADEKMLQTPTLDVNNTSCERGLQLMERNHLAVIFDGHCNLLVTSVLTAAKLRSQLFPVHANHFWYYPWGDITKIVLVQNTLHSAVSLSPSSWKNKSPDPFFPTCIFGVSPYSGVGKPGWAVREMVCDTEFSPVILLIRHDTLLTRKLLIFFMIVLVSWRIRPGRLIWVMFPLVVAILLARQFPPYITILVPSVFWGMVCAVSFGLIRHLRSWRRAIPLSLRGDQTTIVAPNDQEDDSESGEVCRIMVPSYSPVEQQYPLTDIAPASKSVFLMLLALTISGLLFGGTGNLSAQPASYSPSSPDFVPVPAPQGQPLSGSVSETSGNMAGRMRSIMDAQGGAPPYDVYIPYDFQGRLGDQYIIPDSLHQLLQESGKVSAATGNWRICTARYVGTLTHNPVHNEVTLSHLRAIYDIEIEDVSAVVRLPEMFVVPDGIRCDDRLIEPVIEPVFTVDTVRNEYAIAVFGRGGHQLEISLQPTIYYGNPEMMLYCFDFAIPPVPDSTLELTLPVSNLPVDVLQSFGQLSRQPDKLTATLGPVKRLSVSWPISPPPQDNLSVSQYFRLSVAPLSLALAPERTKLHALFRFTLSSGSVKQIRLTVDPRYRLAGDFQSTETIESTEPVADADNLIQITFAQPVMKNVTVEAVFVPKSIISGNVDFSGIGTLALPRFSAASAQIERSWLGISSATLTEVELPLSNVETSFFENAWGFLDEPVHHAYDLQRSPENWFLTVKSRPVFRQIDQRQWLWFGGQSIQTYLEESVTPSYDKTSSLTDSAVDSSPLHEAIQIFSYEMILPEGFRCETVEVNTPTGEPLEKVRVEQNQRNLVLFFKEPVSGKFTVSLFGTIPCQSGKEIPFPLFTHDGQATVQRSVFCSRDSSVHVQQSLDEQSVQWTEEIPCPMPAFPSGYVLSAFRIESPEQFLPATISINPNKPEITGVMVSRLERDYPFTHWNMIVTCDVTISHGELDQFSLFIPLHFSDTLAAFRFDSRLWDIPIKQINKNDGTQVQILPREPLSGKQSFEIQFPVGGTLDAVSVPNVRLQRDCELDHYVALPENFAENPQAWTLTNLSPTDHVPPVLPLQQRVQDPASSLIDMALTYRYYRAGQRDFSAKISSLNETGFVSCQDVAFYIKRNGGYFAVSVFDIQGNDSLYCDIAFPSEYQLILTQLDEIFPLPERIDDATVRVELFPDIPVQRLTLVYCFQGDAAGFAGRPLSVAKERFFGEPQAWPLSLVVPQILSFPVRKTLWEIRYESLPAIDMQVDTLVGVWNGHERFASQHKMNTLAQTDARNLRVRMELARLNQVLAMARLMYAQPQDMENSSRRQTAWLQYWNGTRWRTAHLLPEGNSDTVPWNKAFLHGGVIVPQYSDPFTPEWEAWETSRDVAWMDTWVSQGKTPQVVYNELVDQFQSLAGRAPQPSSLDGRDTVADGWEIRERYLSMTHYQDEPTGICYLAGAASCGIKDLTLVFHPQNASEPPGVYLHYTLWGTVCVILLAMIVYGNIRRLLQRFSVLFVIVLIVVSWLFVKPNTIGWAVLLVLLISAVRLQWDQMRAATAIVTHNHPTANVP